jgi:hypothetical protein
MKLVITDAKRFHCGQMARSMRVEHHAALLKMGVSIHRELRRVFDLSYYSRAAFVDGHLAGLWGLEGSMLSSSAKVWLVLSQYALRFPVTVLRQAKTEIAYMAATKTDLITTMIPDDEPAHRLVAFLGFESPDGFGGGRPRSRSGRNNLLRYLKNNPELMVSAGTASQIGVIYRRDS